MRFRRTTIISTCLIALLAGLAIGRRWPFPAPLWLLVFILLASLKFMPRKTFILIGSILALCLGWWRGSAFRQLLMPYEGLYGQTVIVQVTAATDGFYQKSGNLGFDAGNIHFISPIELKPPGQLKIETLGLPGVFRSDRLEISGKLYPAGGSKQGSIKFAKAKILSRNLNWIEKFRLKFGAAMQSTIPEPQASFGLGILVGQRSTLPESVANQLSTVGLTHVIAVSGYNLTIIITFIGKRLEKTSKFQTTVLSLGLMSCFILITGFSPSIVRAAVVSTLSLGAWYYGRTMKPLLVLLLSAAVTAVWNPVYLWSDIGWYLSFLAFFGVLIIGPLVTAVVWRGREPRGLMPLAIESASAQIMAAPLIMYIFQETSLISLISNMLVVPLIPLAMLLALVAGLTGMTLPIAAAWLGWPARMLLGYALELVDVLSRVPKALVKWPVSLEVMLVWYGLIMAFCWLAWYKTKLYRAKITDEEIDLEGA